jgi:ribose/xylose/arabinose/galactoside ABC-type transport system permease subunit
MNNQKAIQVQGSVFRRLYAGFAKSPFAGIVVAIIIFYIAFSIITPGTFNTVRNQMTILRAASAYLILATGQTFVMTTAGIDLSTGSVLGLVGVIVFTLVIDGFIPSALILPAVIVVGAILGGVNGYTVSRLRVPPLLATLGTFVAYRGVIQLMMGTRLISQIPEGILFVGRGRILGGLQVPIVISVGIALVGAFVLHQTKFGRVVTAVGSNEKAAHAARINVKNVKLYAYALQGALAGIASLILIGRLGSVNASLGQGLELHVIAATVLGGTYLFGGKGTIVGTILGVYLIGALENGLVQIGAGFFMQQIVLGFLIIASVAFQTRQAEKDAGK